VNRDVASSYFIDDDAVIAADLAIMRISFKNDVLLQQLLLIPLLLQFYLCCRCLCLCC
jgi:hypothetical protein